MLVSSLLLTVVSIEGLLVRLQRVAVTASPARNMSMKCELLLQTALVLQTAGCLASLVLTLGAEWRIHTLDHAVEWYPPALDGIRGMWNSGGEGQVLP
jgi:hypothetical protein